MSNITPTKPGHHRSLTQGNKDGPAFKSLRKFLYWCGTKNTRIPRKINYPDRNRVDKYKIIHQRHSSLLDDSAWDVNEESHGFDQLNPDQIQGYNFNVNSSFNAATRKSEVENVLPQHLEPITIGHLAPSDVPIYGGESTDGPLVEVDRKYQDHFDFLYDSEVGTKFRGTTYYRTKKWTKKEDLLLIALQSKFKNNWKKVSEKLANKSTQKDDPKSDTDCWKRWHMVNKMHLQENQSEFSITLIDADGPDTNTETKWTLVRHVEYVWDEERCDKLLHLTSTRGKNWKLFERYFEGCSKYQIKQQYLKLKREGRYPTGFEKQINRQTHRRHHIKGKLGKMPTIMETSNEDMSEARFDESSVSIKLSIKDTIIHGASVHKSSSSSQKKYSAYLRNQCWYDCKSSFSMMSDANGNFIDTSNISENIFAGYSGKNPCIACQKRRGTFVGALSKLFN